jgi:hypothetical protein
MAKKQEAESDRRNVDKRPYEKPHLRYYGQVKKLTQSGSIGNPEGSSGMSMV